MKKKVKRKFHRVLRTPREVYPTALAEVSPEHDARKGVLDTAAAAVLGDRQLNYGTAEDNFSRIAHLHNAYLEVRRTDSGYPVGRENAAEGISPHDVAVMAILTKIARLANTPAHGDSWADIAGYAACGAAVNKVKFNAS